VVERIEACNAVGGSAFRVAVMGTVVEFSGPSRTSTSVGGIIVRVVGTDTFIITEPDGSFVINDLVLNRVTLSFERGRQKAALDLGAMRQSQVINLGELRVQGDKVVTDYRKAQDFWERLILQGK